MSTQSLPPICHRCGKQLTPGQGDFFVVRIEAVADPSGPNISAKDLEVDFDRVLDELLKQMQNLSERELMDQVYRRLRIHLCTPCFDRWFENPTG